MDVVLASLTYIYTNKKYTKQKVAQIAILLESIYLPDKNVVLQTFIIRCL